MTDESTRGPTRGRQWGAWTPLLKFPDTLPKPPEILSSHDSNGEDVLLFLVQHSGMHSGHCLFVIDH